MLAFADPRSRHRRRTFLKVGASSLMGLPFLPVAARAALGSELTDVLRDRSIVFVFMHGGPSQTETFDPKMTAPPGVRSANGAIATSMPGVEFGSGLPKLAQRAHKLAIVRSVQTGDGRHDIKPIVSRFSDDANISTYYARIAGANRPDSGMPTTAALYPRAVEAEAMPAFKNFGDFESTGSLGAAYSPFAPSGGSELRENMKLSLPMDRLDDRRSLLENLDRARRLVEAGGTASGLDALRQQAFDTILGGVADAFSLEKEDPATVRRYDTAPLVRPEQISRRWNNYKRYIDNASSLGKLMLLARRLCERGCGFVTVTTNFVWDMHADQNNAGVEEGMRYMGVPFDHAIATFLDDIEERGLSEKILLVCCGEMGRTPRINGRGGRDHWGRLAPLLIAGGGMKMGQVIGQSSRDAGEPASAPIRIPDLVSTLLHSLIDIGELRLRRGVPAEILRTANAGTPIAELT
ncbi:MAG: DUF1501 domain-containing protein [Maioricimonas sp. JB045]